MPRYIVGVARLQDQLQCGESCRAMLDFWVEREDVKVEKKNEWPAKARNA